MLDGTRTGGARLAAIEDATREDTASPRRDATIAIVLTVPLLALAMTHGAADRVLGETANVVVQLVLGTLVVLGPGRRYLRGGWIAVRHRSPDMNTLIALGAGAAWLSSVVVATRWLAGPRHHLPALYFEAGAAIALGSGTDIAAAAADVTLLRGGISALPTALGLARATLHTIRRNLVAAFAYIPVAAGALYPITGWQLSPVLASAAMSLSSVSVLLSSLRLRTWSPRSA